MAKETQAAATKIAIDTRALRFDRLEWAGAFGDLGTLIPFVIAYISVTHIDPLGILLTFGVCMVIVGLYYRTHFPVQPMKAIGTAAATQAQLGVTAATISAAGLLTGVMNLFSSAFGGVPMCHGAGGMAGHVRFGARTGGAPVILGGVLILLALFFSDSMKAVLAIFPAAILGVILFLTGAQLALGSCDFGKSKNDLFLCPC